jgi:hypothetical protein
MSNTELAVVNQEELDAFANAAGLSADDLSGGADYLPQLKVNYLEENEETKKELKKGTFYLTGQDVTVYAKNVTIRPLLQHFQWTDYSQVEKKTVNRTKFIVNFNEEARDEKGTLKCGKPDSKTLKNNPKLIEEWENVKCYRTLHVLVSYTGVDEDGNEHTVKDVLATMRLKGANFTPFKEEFIDNMPKNSKLWDYELTLGTTREKNDPSSATYFYIIHFDADYSKRLPVTQGVYDLAKSAQGRIDEFNGQVEVKYFKAISEGQKTDRAQDSIDKALDGDFKDDIPF